MKERPILFSDAMVRAILDGTKTQTRRVVKLIGLRHTDVDAWHLDGVQWEAGAYIEGNPASMGFYRCPYGEPGDRLWVRETWWKGSEDEGEAPSRDRGSPVEYRADTSVDAPGGWDAEPRTNRPAWARWRPSIHMPRWASRITLELTDVRVQRVRDITDEDARAEGVRATVGGDLAHRAEFALLWDFINLNRASWASNPWVWALTFKRGTP